jgi:hypothetical protein
MAWKPECRKYQAFVSFPEEIVPTIEKKKDFNQGRHFDIR